MDYQLFNAEEFAADESFNNYYLNKDEKAVAYWTNWISRHPEKLDEVLTAERLLAIAHLRLTELEQEIAFSRFDDFLIAVADDEKHVDDNQDNYTKEYKQPKKSFNWVLTSVAASMVLILTLGLYFYNRPAVAVKTEYLSIHSEYGKIKILTLADGTVVSLNANSTLSYPKYFQNGHREVSLTGEAFFEVAKDKKRPFTVTANGTKTTVLGTKFNVNAYTQQKTAVALLEGSVAFESNSKSNQIILKPSEMVTYTKSIDQTKLTAFSAENMTAWKTGIVLFHSASFADIAFRFKNIYGITLKDETTAQHWNYSGQFTKSDYLTIIKSICFAKNLSYKQINHTIILNDN